MDCWRLYRTTLTLVLEAQKEGRQEHVSQQKPMYSSYNYSAPKFSCVLCGRVNTIILYSVLSGYSVAYIL